MYAVISHDQIQLPSGAVVRMPGTWQDYCSLRSSCGDGAIPRIKFRDREILLMSPLPRHGREANILADVVKILKNRLTIYRLQNESYQQQTMSLYFPAANLPALIA